jgi:thymidylate synthase
MPHIEAVKTQLKRCPYGFPKLTITKKLDTIKDIETLDFNDIIITNYKSHPIIKSDMIA